MASPDYGIQAFLWWRPEVADRDLGLIQEAGFTWVKQLFSWQDIEGAGKGQFDWTNADRVVDEVMLAPAAVKRLIEPSEIAELAAYLCSDAAARMSGAAIPIDGGWTAR
mgnify:CR=1 FL=1